MGFMGFMVYVVCAFKVLWGGFGNFFGKCNCYRRRSTKSPKIPRIIITNILSKPLNTSKLPKTNKNTFLLEEKSENFVKI